jgi:hypothetical protein
MRRQVRSTKPAQNSPGAQSPTAAHASPTPASPATRQSTSPEPDTMVHASPGSQPAVGSSTSQGRGSTQRPQPPGAFEPSMKRAPAEHRPNRPQPAAVAAPQHTRWQRPPSLVAKQSSPGLQSARRVQGAHSPPPPNSPPQNGPSAPNLHAATPASSQASVDVGSQDPLEHSAGIAASAAGTVASTMPSSTGPASGNTPRSVTPPSAGPTPSPLEPRQAATANGSRNATAVRSAWEALKVRREDKRTHLEGRARQREPREDLVAAARLMSRASRCAAHLARTMGSTSLPLIT